MAVYQGMDEKEFCAYVETTVQETIKRFDLIPEGSKLLVAVSGGKDSQVLLVILKALGYQPDALLIDEGIHDYREHTIKDMEALCAKLDVPLTTISFAQEVGATLDVMLDKKHIKPCTLCGTFRRYNLNKYAKGYDVIATGHNLDDESQVIVMNVLTGQTTLLPRLGPKSGLRDGTFVQRIKPLYLIKEKEVRLYAFLKGLSISPKECPYAHEAFRNNVRDWLNAKEQAAPGTKRNVIDWFLDNEQQLATLAEQDSTVRACSLCAQPSHGIICKACQLKHEIFA